MHVESTIRRVCNIQRGIKLPLRYFAFIIQQSIKKPSDYFVTSAEDTVVTDTLPFGLLDVLQSGGQPVGLVKPLSHTGLSHYQRSGAEEMEEVSPHHHVRMDLKRIVKYGLT